MPSLKREIQFLAAGLYTGNTNPVSLLSQVDQSVQRALRAITDNTTATTTAATEVSEILKTHNKEVARARQGEKEEAAVQRLLNSLYFPSMNMRRNMSSLEAVPGSFNWVLDSKCRHCHVHLHDDDDEDGNAEDNDNDCRACLATSGALRLWLLSDEQCVFWISGHAGTGKSTLISHLIRQISNGHIVHGDSFRPKKPMVLSAFIWSSGDGMQRSTKGLMCTLLHQALSHMHKTGTRSPIQASAAMLKQSTGDWREKELCRALLETLQIMSTTTFIFIDGLDEISTDESQNLLDIIDTLRTNKNIKLCVSSRPELSFERALQHYPHLRLQDLNHDDIVNYLHNKLGPTLQSLPESDRVHHCAQALVGHLSRQSRGIFLWIELLTNSLRDGINNEDTWEQLWARVERIPDGLDALYKTMLQRRDTVAKDVYHDSSAIFFALLLLLAAHRMHSLAAISLYLDASLRDAYQDDKLG